MPEGLMHATTRAVIAVLVAASIGPTAPRAAEEEAPPAPTSPAPQAADDAEPSAAGAGRVEEMVVTATRAPRPRRDVPAAVTVLPRAEIERSPSKTVDELLRIVPSFGLFRRTSSMVSDPTAQGVNLRGIGPSGVSRSLVLVDGIPANDPFGGWVYWRAIPRIGAQRIEVVPGGGSALYGNYALGGVTQVFSRPIEPSAFEASAEYGSLDTALFGARASRQWGPVGASLETELFASSGYPVVARSARGSIDAPAPSRHATVNARVEAEATPELSLGLRGGYFTESENGGTQFTTAAVKRLEYVAAARYAPAEVGVLDLSVFGHGPHFDQGRARVSSVASPRDTEVLAGSQSVPSHDLGAGLLGTSRPLAFAGTHRLTLGGDVRRITGATREDLSPAAVTAATVVGRETKGQQRLTGAFAQDVWDLSGALALDLAVRYDRWDNLDASRFERLGDGSTSLVPFSNRSNDEVSPKVGARLRPIEWLTVRAAAYRAFRAPTLNELYRPFQVGTVFTQANERLQAETLEGAEAGLELATPIGATARLTGFWNRLHDPITNVTIGTNLQQRQNLGQARIRGIEAEVGWRFARTWLGTAAYTLAESRVTDAPGQPQLVGRQLPQDPKHRASASLAFDDPRLLSATAQVRYLGRQYEDDQNTRPMDGALIVDLSASRRLASGVDLILAVENLFDKTYLVGRAGVDTVGQPRFIHGGVRFRLGEP
jgi:outer membrane receptor protein involved in Fe transport